MMMMMMMMMMMIMIMMMTINSPRMERFYTRIASQIPYADSLALCVTDMTGVHPTPQPKPANTDFGLQP